uniref:Uncharacterized protein n=1 Tax=Lactuca sativa TaxID=4236 RepID=A0A9R1WKU1_LACSA|nr:hypothetical protein LSAT_V11C100000020 [Lactuca sativa]
MVGVPPDLEPDVIMRKKGKIVNSKNKSKEASINVQEMIANPVPPKSVSLLVKKFDSDAKSPDSKEEGKFGNTFNEGTVIENSSNSSDVNFDAASMAPLTNCNPIKMEDGMIEGLSSPVHEFEKDIELFCSPGEKDAMLCFWNGLSSNEKEGFVHGLRFIKKKYNKEGEYDSEFDDSIDNIRKISSVSQRNDILMNWKDLNQKKKEKVFHKLCTSKIKKQVEANFGKNRVPFKPSSSLFPAAIDMKKHSDLEASDGLQKVGETVLEIIPEGVPVLSSNETVVVDLQKLCAMQPQVKDNKIKRKIEIDELVSKQIEQVCNAIDYNFPSKFNQIDLANEGEFKFNYVDADEKELDAKMIIDGNEDICLNSRNTNGGLLITKEMLEQMKMKNLKSEEQNPIPKPNSMEVEKNHPVSYAEKVSGKKLNAANLISKIKKMLNFQMELWKCR